MAESDSERSPDELVYVLNNLTGLQSFAGGESPIVLECVHDLLDRRAEFEEGGIVDAACATFAAYSRSQPAAVRQASFEVLRDTLADRAIDVEARGAAARSIGEIGATDSVGDLADVALDPLAPLRLRQAAVQGIAAISRSSSTDSRTLESIADVFTKLLAVDQFQSADLQGDVIHEYARFAQLEDFPKFVALLSRKDDNLYAERAIWDFLMRFPGNAQTIVYQTLVVAAHLSDDQARTLMPGPAGMLSDFQGWEFYPRADYFVACRAVAPALANATATSPDDSVRRLAGQNLSQLLTSVPLPIIDADASPDNRRKQLAAWNDAWHRIADDLTINGDGQLEARSAEIVAPL